MIRRSVGGATIGIVLFACAPAPVTAIPEPTPEVTPTPPATTPATISAAPRATTIAPRTPPQTLVPIDGVPPGAVIRWPTTLENAGAPTAVLFDDELAAMRRAVASSLTRRKHVIVPAATLDTIEAAAATGKLVLEGDRTCASPLSRDEVHARYFAARPQVTIETVCFDDCRLAVTLEHGDTTTESFATNAVRRPEDPKQWIAAASHLDDTLDAMGGLGLIGTSQSPPIRFGMPSWVGPWRTAPTEAQFLAIEPRAAACAHPDPAMDLVHVVRASIDRRGHVARCVAEGPHSIARAVDEACLCEVFGDLRFGAGSATRRLRITATDTGFAPSSGTLTPLQPGTESWIARIRDPLVLERCSTLHPLVVDLDATVSLALQPDGRVDEARIDGAIVDRGAMQWATCVIGELEALALPCAPPGIDTLQARLVFDAP